MINITEAWKTVYPGAVAGVMVLSGVANPQGHPKLEARKQEIEARLRAVYAGYDRAALRALPVLQAYHQYYKRFDKTYHVQLQLESVVLKGKPITSVGALVEAVFMAELEDGLLTAVHDMDAVHLPLKLDISKVGEPFTQLGGQEQALKPDDMIMADAGGVICSVIYGSDQRTRLTPQTQRALFVTYAPPGIGDGLVRQHLGHIQANVCLLAPQAVVEALDVY